MHRIKLGKVDLGDEAQRPGATADLPEVFLVGLDPFVDTLPLLCAEEPVEPMEAAKENAIRQNGSIFNGSNFRVERRSDRPIDIRRQIGLAAQVTCSNRSCAPSSTGPGSRAMACRAAAARRGDHSPSPA
jgi:hypothetical protein